MKQSKLDSMSLDELFMLHERLTATLEARITAEKKALKDRLKDFGLTGRELMKLSDNQSQHSSRTRYPQKPFPTKPGLARGRHLNRACVVRLKANAVHQI